MRSSSKASLFLIELIIVIAFFSVASATCIELFAHSNTISSRSHNLNMAINMTQSAAECFRAAKGDPQRVLELLPGGASSQPGGIADGIADGITVSYDKDWQPLPGGEFRLLLQTSRDGSIAIGDIAVRGADGKELYSLRVECYVGSEGAV